MILPDDMVSRMQDNARRRQAEDDASDMAQTVTDRRHVVAAILAAIAVSILIFWTISVLSQAS